MRPRGALIPLLVSVVALVLVVPAYAGFGSGTGPDGETLFGYTWFRSYQDLGYTWYDGKAQTWRGTTVYRIRARGETYNDCDYWHKISDRTVDRYYATYVDTGFLPAGEGDWWPEVTRR